VTHGASNGDQVLLAGGSLSFTPETCAEPDAGYGAGVVSWVSSDGRVWIRSNTFGHRHSTVASLWFMDDGWMAALSSWDRAIEIWRSRDAVTWDVVGSIEGTEGVGMGTPLQAPDGRWIALGYGRSTYGLQASGNGIHWQQLPASSAFGDAPPFDLSELERGAGSRWIFATNALHHAEIWTSDDLAAWTPHDFPDDHYVQSLLAFSEGFVAIATPCSPHLADAPCYEDEAQYFSPDGEEWHLIGREIGPAAIGDGPLGVLAVTSADGSVWLLTE
jgi:hypothetical protein